MTKKLFIVFLIGLFFTSCSSLEFNPDDSDNLNGDADSGKNPSETTYIFLKVSAPEISSRDDDDKWEYEDGTVSENAVNHIRLYFFENGTILRSKPDSDEETDFNYFYDWYHSEDSESEGRSRAEGDITKTLTRLLSLKFDTKSRPNQIVAIVNPNQSILDLPNPSLKELEDIVADFKTDLTDHNFLMSNSVYLTTEDGIRRLINATPIHSYNICTTPEKALLNPVNVYVDRIVARLDFSFAQPNDDLQPVENENNIFDTGITLTLENGNEQKVLVEFKGWAITSSPKQSRLLKSLDPSWSDNLFKRESGSWNQETICRSFWAINPEEIDYNWYSYNDITGEDNPRGAGCFSLSENSAYMQENANPFKSGTVTAANPQYPTKVIFCARLLTEDRQPLSIAEYEGVYYTYSGFKALIASKLDMYRETDSPLTDGDKYVKITPEELTFETSMSHSGISGPDTDGTYFVYVCLTKEAALKTWYHKFDNEEEKDDFEIKQPQNYLDKTLSQAKVWKEGNTYYYFDIPHFGGEKEDPGYLGVVRNHIYDAKIVKIKSLGVPVYDPDEIIYPEEPGPGGNMLYVTIRVLQWRLVNQHFQISW